jgi:hypothetical protein
MKLYFCGSHNIEGEGRNSERVGVGNSDLSGL